MPRLKPLLLCATLAGLLGSPLLVSAQVGATSVAPAPSAKAQATDKNGDGKLSKDEVEPGTSIAQRFDDLDLNHDGALTQNEYVSPSASIDHLSGRKNPLTGSTEGAPSATSDVHGNRASN